MAIKVGIVGIGFGQAVLLPAFRTDPRCEVTALCASTEARAAAAAAKHAVPHAFGDWHALVADPTLEAIAIATPPSVQPVIAEAALLAGKAVFCEKPLSTTFAEAQALAEAAEDAKVPNVVDFAFPQIEAWQAAKQRIEAGQIGAIRHLTVSWHMETYANRMNLANWKTQDEFGGGTLLSFVSHTFHYVEWLAGRIQNVSASLRRAPGDERTGDTLALVQLDLASGAAVSITASGNAPFGSGHRVEIYGDEGALILENRTSDYMRGFTLQHGRRGGALEMVDLPPLSADSDRQDGRVLVVSRLTRLFLDWMTGSERHFDLPTFADGARVQHLLDTAKSASSEGKRLSLPLENQ